MKNIRIKTLRLENFKCHKSLVLDFNGGDASIYGDNATGKTSIYDALTWLLFGKDSKGNGEKNIEIKPLGADGEVLDHLAETAVEAVLLVDGEEITLRRTQKEVWSTKRGSTEAVFDGNTSEFYIDGVPCKKYVFTEKIDELVNEDTFRLLTSVSHFADGISWQDRRAVLFQVAAVADDETILASDERFRPLIDGKGRLSIDDYKKKLVAEKRGFVGAKTEIPARINECQKTIEDVQALDFDAARASLEMLNAKSERLRADLLAIEHDTASEKKRMEIDAAGLDLERLEGENRLFRSQQTANAPDMEGMKRRLSYLQAQHSSKSLQMKAAAGAIETCDKEIAASRERWISTNAEIFSSGTCLSCGQPLPAAQLAVARDNFEAQKARRLREIEQTANAHKESRAGQEARLGELTEESAALESEITKIAGELTAAEKCAVEPVDMEGYAEKKAEMQEKIRALQSELADMAQGSASVKAEIQRQIEEAKSESDKQRDIISKEALLAYSQKRIEELREDAANAAACLDAIESMLFLIDEYSRYKTRYVEDSINGMFRIARFRLFREQANGGVEDRCDVVLDGIPYINLNSGAKINVGIDIINALSAAYGVSVPLFVDNAESVTRLEESKAQIIRLVVAEKEKEIKVSYEN
ncbi:MAG: AAA family ATPase [Clostridia bacterium]|nr:AAA family ATPase [Clostridia bacterium]